MRTLLVTAATLAAAASTAWVASPPPQLARSGTMLRGAHFGRHELVRISFLAPVPGRRRLRTTALGTFATPLPPFDPCVESLQVVVRGAHGELVRLKLPPRQCPVP
ncbi:MAG TPA: hypothetical protein VFL60_01740 [Gaiellaceae bacterium]|nr:hypothetical protein [Gaiellaceae bacterium]